VQLDLAAQLALAEAGRGEGGTRQLRPGETPPRARHGRPDHLARQRQVEQIGDGGRSAAAGHDGRVDQWQQPRRVEHHGVLDDPVRCDPDPLGRIRVDTVERDGQAGVDGPEDRGPDRACRVAEPAEQVERVVDVGQHVVDRARRSEQVEHLRRRGRGFVQSL
jgi:hypothetical protein